MMGTKNAKIEWFNPYERLIRQKRYKKEINEKLAREVINLFEANELPGWVVEQLDIEAFKLVIS